MTIAPLAGLLAQKRLLIFDLDGTLVDSSPLHARAFAEACAPWGIAVDYRTVAGMTTEQAVDRLAGAAGVVLTPEVRLALIARKRELAKALIDTELAAIPGAPAFVQAAGGHWRRALCTSASRVNADAALRRVGLDGCFDWIVTANDVARGKPDPEIFLAALDRAGVTAEQALVFEDAPSGLAAAAAAGIAAIEVVMHDARADADANMGRDTMRATWPVLNAALALATAETAA